MTSDERGAEKQLTVLTFGEMLYDLLPDGRATLGGAALNFAARIAALGNRSLLISRVGSDDLGAKALQESQRLHIDCTYVQHDFHFPTGTVPVTFENNQPHYVITPNVAFDHIMYNDNIASAAASADAFYFGTLIQREEISSATLGAIIKLLGPNCHRVLDINLRAHCYSREILEWSLDHATMVKLSDQEALYIAHEFGLKFTVEEDLPAEIAKTWGLQACIVTHGANGVFAYGANEPPIHIPGMTVDVVDTVGAGDAFIAGVVHRLLRSGTLAAACRFGNALGAMVATVQGGTAPVDYKRVASLANEPAAPAAQS